MADEPSQVFLAVQRTRLALERTLMAWVRTAVSLIMFGFTLNTAKNAVRAIAPDASTHRALLGVHEFAVGTLITGMMALVLATVQHVTQVRRLNRQGPPFPLFSVALVVAFALLVLGALAMAELIRTR